MITRAIVEQKINEYQYRVRIPIFDKAASAPLSTNLKDLCIAVASMPKGIYNSLQEGDVVLVGFEDNSAGSPVILGHLYREALNNIQSFPTIIADVLQVNNQVNLPTNTTIGTIDYSSLFSLDGIKGNVQSQIDNLTNQLKSLTEKVAKL